MFTIYITEFLQFFVTEHCVLLLRVVLLAIAPSVPKWVLDARDILEFRKINRYRTADEIAEEQRLHQEYAERMKDSLRGLRDMLQFKTEDQLHEVFLRSDPVRGPP